MNFIINCLQIAETTNEAVSSVLKNEIIVTMEQILTVVGIISVVVGFIRIIWSFTSNYEWIDDINIITLENEWEIYADSEGNVLSPTVCYLSESFGNVIMFKPKNTIIKKMYLFSEHYDEKKKKYIKDKTIDIFRNISPNCPLCIRLDIPECFPIYAIAWKGIYGAKTKYEFSYNGRDGNYNLSGIIYHYGVIAKIRKVIGLK